MDYDKSNIFAGMINGAIKVEKIFENDVCLAFNDIKPVAPVHVLVIPKGEYISFDDFAHKAKPEFIAKFFQSVREVANQLGLAENGYRILFNHGMHASQTVFHFHVHILGGGPLHRM